MAECAACGRELSRPHYHWSAGIDLDLCGQHFWKAVDLRMSGRRRELVAYLESCVPYVNEKFIKRFDAVTVEEIRLKHAMGELIADLAVEYGRDYQSIYALVRGLTYQEAPGPIRGKDGNRT